MAAGVDEQEQAAGAALVEAGVLEALVLGVFVFIVVVFLSGKS